MDAPSFLDYDGACAVFHEHGLTHIGRDWLKRRAATGELPSTLIAKKRCFLRQDVLDHIAALAENTRGPRPRRRTRRIQTRF